MEEMKDRIRQVRESKELNQSDFAKGIGMSSSSINKIEKGSAPIEERTILAISKKYDVSEIWIKTGIGYMPNGAPDKDPEKSEFLSIYDRLSPASKNLLLKIARDIFEGQNSGAQKDKKIDEPKDQTGA
jgi:transcriptional regulator with XRE-family HTH domain